MIVKVQHTHNGVVCVEDVKPLFTCKHVADKYLYPTLADVKFKETSEILVVEEENSQYGFSVLYLKDKQNGVYEYTGFGHSGACSIVTALLRENMELTNRLNNADLRIKELEEKYEPKLVEQP